MVGKGQLRPDTRVNLWLHIGVPLILVVVLLLSMELGRACHG
jgi:hypothetical protein